MIERAAAPPGIRTQALRREREGATTSPRGRKLTTQDELEENVRRPGTAFLRDKSPRSRTPCSWGLFSVHGKQKVDKGGSLSRLLKYPPCWEPFF